MILLQKKDINSNKAFKNNKTHQDLMGFNFMLVELDILRKTLEFHE